MKRKISGFRNALLALVVLGAIGFGATQAVATSDGSQSMKRVCSKCFQECGDLYGQRLGDRCYCCG